MTAAWVEYKQGTAIQESIALAAALAAQGRRLILMNQGAEESVAPGERQYTGLIDPSYNKLPGGHPEHRAIVAGFARDGLGLPATASNTFLFASNGRNGLSYAFYLAADPIISRGMKAWGVVPTLQWPMVEDEAHERYVRQVITYEMERGKLAQAIGAAVNTDMRRKAFPGLIGPVYTNFPNNPLGLASSPEEMKDVQAVLDAVNEARMRRDLPPVAHIADTPYFGGAPVKDTGAFLQTAYEGVFRIDGGTPTIIDISFSKALGTARPGVHALVLTDTAMAAEFTTLIKSKTGMSYEPALFDLVAGKLHPDNYPVLKEHFRKLGEKYRVNLAFVQAQLGAHLLDADPNMVCTIRIPDAALNKLVTCFDGAVRPVRTGREVAEYIANTHGVVVVDQSVGDRQLLRLALKAEDPAVADEGAQKIALAYAELQNAPTLEAA
jgi:aspartate/methionine/tyrosine aminotransferase